MRWGLPFNMPCREGCGTCSISRLVLAAFACVSLSLSALSQGPGSATAGIASYTPALTYDVTVVKKSQPEAASFAVGIRDLPHSGDFSATHEPVKMLIQDAYGVSSAYVSGGPLWINTDPFDIQAKSSPSVSEQLINLGNDTARLEKEHMLQTLLAQRFNLKVHWVPKEMSAYSLVVAKNGPKITKSKDEAPDAAGSGSAVTPKGPPIQVHSTSAGYELIAQGVPIKTLVSILGQRIRTPVLDNTGLAGNYNFTLQFLPEGQAETDDAWPSVFTAVQEQLGLKLESTKTSVATLVIDSIEQPTEN
jgi:uncharacterized protein (TIGR03435 family)